MYDIGYFVICDFITPFISFEVRCDEVNLATCVIIAIPRCEVFYIVFRSKEGVNAFKTIVDACIGLIFRIIVVGDITMSPWAYNNVIVFFVEICPLLSLIRKI